MRRRKKQKTPPNRRNTPICKKQTNFARNRPILQKTDQDLPGAFPTARSQGRTTLLLVNVLYSERHIFISKSPGNETGTTVSAVFVDALRTAILENLSSKSSSPTIITFRHDVFQHLFYKKGSMVDDGKYVFLNKEDFSRCSWTERVLYPTKIKLFLSRSPRIHVLVDGVGFRLVPRNHIEKLSIQCQKRHITLSISY